MTEIKSNGKATVISSVFTCPFCQKEILKSKYCPECGADLTGYVFIESDV